MINDHDVRFYFNLKSDTITKQMCDLYNCVCTIHYDGYDLSVDNNSIYIRFIVCYISYDCLDEVCEYKTYNCNKERFIQKIRKYKILTLI